MTVVTAVMNERARKTENDFVTHKPAHLIFVSMFYVHYEELYVRSEEEIENNLRWATHNCGSEEDQRKHKMSSPEDISQRTQEEQSSSISRLHQRRYSRSLFISDIEFLR